MPEMSENGTNAVAFDAVPFDNTSLYEIPVDPMDDLQCESCQ
jgi:hypothetical protein